MDSVKPTENITRFGNKVTPEDRARLTGCTGRVIWFTGLSGSGKSTVAAECERLLLARGKAAYLLDGDNVRFGLCAGLGFSDADRNENIRRIAEAAALMCDAGLTVLVSVISPFAAMREYARSRVPEGKFTEVWVSTPIEECERRDVKGLYRKARAGLIKGFTGIDSPYEPPVNPEVTVDTSQVTVAEAAEAVLSKIV